MRFCPHTTVFLEADIRALLRISSEEISNMHLLGVLTCGACIDNVAGGVIAMPNAFDLLNVSLALNLPKKGWRKIESIRCAEVVVSAFADFIDSLESSRFTEYGGCSLAFEIKIRNDFGAYLDSYIFCDREITRMLSCMTIAFWGEIFEYCHNKCSKIECCGGPFDKTWAPRCHIPSGSMGVS